MYNTLLRMWKKHKITEDQVRKAVTEGWITEQQCAVILATPQDPVA